MKRKRKQEDLRDNKLCQWICEIEIQFIWSSSSLIIPFLSDSWSWHFVFLFYWFWSSKHSHRISLISLIELEEIELKMIPNILLNKSRNKEFFSIRINTAANLLLKCKKRTGQIDQNSSSMILVNLSSYSIHWLMMNELKKHWSAQKISNILSKFSSDIMICFLARYAYGVFPRCFTVIFMNAKRKTYAFPMNSLVNDDRSEEMSVFR